MRYVAVEARVRVAPRFVAMLILLGHPHLVNEAVELDMCQCLREAVGNHLVSWYIGEFDSSFPHLVTDVMVLEIDVFRPGMEDGVVCQCNRSLVVAFQRDDNLHHFWRFGLFVSLGQLVLPPSFIMQVLVDGVDTSIVL